MPLFDIYDNASGRTLTVEGATAPTDQDAEELFAQFHGVPPGIEALKPNPIPGMGQIPGQEGRGGNPTVLKPQAGPITDKAPTIRDMINNPVSKFMGEPIAPKILPASIMERLSATSKMGPAPAEKAYQDVMASNAKLAPGPVWNGKTKLDPHDADQAQFLALHPELLRPNPAATDFYKGAAAKINPGQIATLIGTAMGGIPGFIANASMGVQGGLEATDPERSAGERVMGGVSGLAGLVGAMPGLKALKQSILANAAPKIEAAPPALGMNLPARLAAAKTPQEMKAINEEIKLLADKAQGEAAVLKIMEGVKKTDAAKAAADEARRQASGTLSHFSTLDPKVAGQEAKVLSLAEKQQKLDELARTAGEDRPSLSEDQVNYFKPPEKGSKGAAQPTKSKADSELQARVEAQIAQTKANTPEVKVPSIDEVMFSKPKLSSQEFLAQGGTAKGAETPDYFEPPTPPTTPTKPRMTAAQVTERGIPLVKPRIRLSATGVEVPPPTPTLTPAEDLAARLGTPPDTALPIKPTKVKAPRTEDVLRDNPRFQSLSKEERATRYKELGGVDAELKKSPLNRPDTTDPNKLYSGVDPNLLISALKHPGMRAIAGAGVGSQVDEEHPYLGAMVGAGTGMVAAPGKYGGGLEAIKNIVARRYESLLSGAPQLSNIGGNIGGTVAAPILEALRGNIGGAGKLAKHILSPETIPTWLRDAVQEFKTAKHITRLGEEVKTVGPAGKVLQSVDKATKNLLHGGGLSEAAAGDYTLSNLPSTKSGKLAKQVQAAIPGTQIFTPFINTVIKANEMAAATSPLRFTSKALRDMVPAQDYVTKGGTKIPKAVFEALLTLPALAAGGAGLAGVHAPFESTIGQVPASATLGPFALPYQTGRQIRNYAKYGRDNPKDVAEAFLSNVPLAGDLPAKMQNPLKSIADLPAQFIPQVSMMIGDKTVRETKADDTKPWANQLADMAENSIKARLPWERTKLPAKRTFLGDEKKRNFLGQYPADDFETDKLAAWLSDHGFLRRSPNQSLGSLSPQAKILKAATSNSFTNRPGLQELVEALTPIGNVTTTPAEESRLGELRGKSVRQDLTPMMNNTRRDFTKDEKGKAIYEALMELAISSAHAKGTKAFKTERIIEAAKKARP